MTVGTPFVSVQINPLYIYIYIPGQAHDIDLPLLHGYEAIFGLFLFHRGTPNQPDFATQNKMYRRLLCCTAAVRFFVVAGILRQMGRGYRVTQ